MSMFKRSFAVVLLCVFFACYSAAWGEQTQEYICEKAVEKAWGSALANKCLGETAQNKENLCSLLRQVRGEEDYSACMALSSVHPALVPYRIFNDTALHYNYEDCPLPKSDAQLRSWACNDSGRNLAMEQANLWLSSMNESVGCERIYRFCIGSNYFSDSFMPLYQLMYVTPASIEEMDARVDKLVVEGKKPWGIDVSAAFQAKSKPRSVRRFEVNSRMIDDIINRLAVAAGKQPEPVNQTKVETCSDGVRNQGETGVDCGGPCTACKTPKAENCSDGLRNQGETGVDCGGPCTACPQPDNGGWSIFDYLPQIMMGALFVGAAFLLLVVVGAIVLFIVRLRKTVKPKVKRKVTEDSGLDEIGDQLNDIKSALKRLE